MQNIQGWINLYKPKNISSFKAINEIKKKYAIINIGHAGTLDPLAQGILPIAVGKATKLISYINHEFKTYIFTVSWGTQTSTDDSEGKVLFSSKAYPDISDINNKIIKYIGHIKQVPPKISAIKINGQRAYKLSRQNINFHIQPKDVYVKSLKIIEHQTSKTTFKIECGKGFYIRSLARDIAIELKTYGHVSYLERSKVGKFTTKNSILLDDLLKIGQRQLEINCIIPTISMLDDILAYEVVNQNDLENISFGRSIKIDESNLTKTHSIDLGKKNDIFLSSNGDIVSIGKLTGNLFKPNKVLI